MTLKSVVCRCCGDEEERDTRQNGCRFSQEPDAPAVEGLRRNGGLMQVTWCRLWQRGVKRFPPVLGIHWDGGSLGTARRKETGQVESADSKLHDPPGRHSTSITVEEELKPFPPMQTLTSGITQLGCSSPGLHLQTQTFNQRGKPHTQVFRHVSSDVSKLLGSPGKDLL